VVDWAGSEARPVSPAGRATTPVGLASDGLDARGRHADGVGLREPGDGCGPRRRPHHVGEARECLRGHRDLLQPSPTSFVAGLSVPSAFVGQSSKPPPAIRPWPPAGTIARRTGPPGTPDGPPVPPGRCRSVPADPAVSRIVARRGARRPRSARRCLTTSSSHARNRPPSGSGRYRPMWDRRASPASRAASSALTPPPRPRSDVGVEPAIGPIPGLVRNRADRARGDGRPAVGQIPRPIAEGGVALAGAGRDARKARSAAGPPWRPSRDARCLGA